MFRLLVYACILAVVVYVGSTVKLGKHTFFEHVRAIWHTEQVQDLKTGVEEKAKPAVDKLKRGSEAAINAMRHGDSTNAGDAGVAGDIPDAGSDARPSDAHVGSGSGSGSAARPHRRR